LVWKKRKLHESYFGSKIKVFIILNFSLDTP
jgi:hypothetical protein